MLHCPGSSPGHVEYFSGEVSEAYVLSQGSRPLLTRAVAATSQAKSHLVSQLVAQSVLWLHRVQEGTRFPDWQLGGAVALGAGRCHVP